MGSKSWILGLIVLVVILGLAIWGFSKNDVKQLENLIPSAGDTITGDEEYFSQDAKVMYFYQPNCHYCVLQSPILKELAIEGYRVKPMDASKEASYWKEYAPEGKYKIEGTPIFIADNGDRLNGYNDKETLKMFLESHK